MKGLWTTRLGVAVAFVIVAGAGVTGMQVFSGSSHAASTT